MAKKILRTMEAYSIHGHVRPGTDDEGLLDYEDFFKSLSQSDPHDLRFPVGGDTVAISDMSTRSGTYAFHFVSGNAEELTLVYDFQTATAEEVDQGRDRFVVKGIWVIIDADQRMVVVERKRPGVPLFQIERFLSQFGRERLGIPALTISLNPVPSESFIREVESFTRIREASITLRRPNHSWTRSVEGMLGNLGASNAADIQLQLNADRGQSLSKSQGVVHEIIELAKRPITALKNAVIKGNTPAFEGERAVSLSKHNVRGTVKIDPSEGPLQQLEPLIVLATQLVDKISLVGPSPAEGRPLKGARPSDSSGTLKELEA